MLVKAANSFVGKICMKKGEEKEIEDKEVIDDLLKAGYITTITPKKNTKTVPKSKKVTT